MVVPWIDISRFRPRENNRAQDPLILCGSSSSHQQSIFFPNNARQNMTATNLWEKRWKDDSESIYLVGRLWYFTKFLKWWVTFGKIDLLKPQLVTAEIMTRLDVRRHGYEGQAPCRPPCFMMSEMDWEWEQLRVLRHSLDRFPVSRI